MSKRIEWIDTLRGVAMFFVILGHAFIKRNNIVRNYIYSFHMPLFYFISGLTTKRRDTKFFDYLFKKVKSILVPYLFLNIFIFIFKFIMNMLLGMYKGISITLALEYFIKGHSNYIPCIQSWFLLSLFIIDILFFIITKITRNDIELSILIFILFILGYFYSKSDYTFLVYWHIDTSLIGILYYYIGYMFMKYFNKIRFIFSNIKSLILIIFTIPVGYYLQYINDRVSMNANRYNNIYLYLVSSIITIFSLVVLVNILLKKDKLFNGIGKMSIFYLGYHGVLLTPLKEYSKVMLSNNILTVITAFILILIFFPISKLALRYCPILVGRFKKEEVK